MRDDVRPRRGLRRLLGHSLFVGAGAIAASAPPADAAAVDRDVDIQSEEDTEEDAEASLGAALDENLGTVAPTADGEDMAVAGHRLAVLLEGMNPFDATCAATAAALSDSTSTRLALAEALASPFRLVGAGFVLEHLAHDADREVRVAAWRAAAVRRLDVQWP
jgi:hypothetical protein